MTSSIPRASEEQDGVIARLLLGESLPMRRLRSLIARVAPSRSAVLIQGATGTGKELVAEALHVCSGRPGAFVPFNVCAIGDGTFEAALFGHARGAFTGAFQDAPGYLAEADRGTAFFDEIGSLPMAAQAKLLRAVETRSFRPVGARRDRSSDFRLVAASNDDLEALVRAGQFRADLLHRLRAMVIRVPPLAERPEDVPLLARHFARQQGDTTEDPLSDEAIDRLMDHAWPGNVRELRNVVEFAIALADDAVVGAAEVAEALGADVSLLSRDDDAWTRQRVLAVLEDCNGNTVSAARRLGIHRSNVYRLMRRLGISPPKRRRLVGSGPSDSSVSAPSPPAEPRDEFALFATGIANSRPSHANRDERETVALD